MLKIENLKNFDVKFLKNSNKLQILAVLAYIFNKFEVDKLKSYFPNLKRVGVYEGKKDLVHDKANQLKSHYDIYYESTNGLN